MSETLSEETLSELAEQVGLELIETLLVELSQDAGDRVKRMQDLLAANDTDNLRKEAHTLKSSCGSLGLLQIQEQSALIERKLVTGEGPDYAPLVPKLPTMLEEGLAAANAWVTRQ